MASGAEVRQGAERYRFDGIVVDAAAHTLVRDGGIQQVEPKAFAVLLELLRHPGQMIDRDRLLDAVWGHRHVTPGVLTRAIAQLRTALNDSALHPRYIQTQHALGYRFVGTLEEEPEAVSAESASDAPVEGEPYRPMPHAGAERRFEPRYRAGWWLLAALLLASALAWGAWQRRGAAAHAAAPSIAVLPFTTLSDDRRDDYFAEGLATEMHSALAGVRGIKVAAWLPPQAIDRKLDMQALGRKLGVATVLDATVRREGQRFRISARLSDTADGVTLWSRTYERDAAAIFDTQSDIASEVATALVGVLPDAGEGLRRRLTPTRNLAAFDAYLKGLQLLLRPAAADGNAESAMGYFRQALDRDKNFARAQAGICRIEVGNFIDRHDSAAFENASASCDRAREMDPGSGEVALALGELHDAKGEFGKAIEYYAHAESDPAWRAAAYAGIAVVHARQGRREQALEYFNRALALQPADAGIHAQIGYQQYLAGRVSEAIASYRKAVELRPDDAILWGYLGGLYGTAGQIAEAEDAMTRSIEVKPNYVALSGLGELKYLSGHYAEAVELRRKALQLDSSDYETWGNLGQALLADPSTAAQAPAAFREAASRAQRYIEIKSDDAMALAQMGWFQANLDLPALARQLIARSEAMGGEPGEVALMNAQTFARLGDLEQARDRIAAARTAGIADFRIDGNAALRRALEPIDGARFGADKPEIPNRGREPTTGE